MLLISALFSPSLLVFVGVASIPVFLFWCRKRLSAVGKGYYLILSGVAVLTLALFADYMKDVLIGFNETGGQTFHYALQFETLNALLLYLPGSILVAWGLSTFLPAVQRLSAEIGLRKETERELLQAKTDAEIANATKSQFLANMSHELRTPLNAILGFSDILKNESFGGIGMPIYKEYAEDIHSSGKHLLDLINDILDVAKIEAGRLQLSEEVIEVKSVVRTCTNMLSLMSEEAEVKLKVEMPDDLPDLYADNIRLRQILSNLLSNALKFTNPGGSVTVKAGLNEYGGLYISVADTGIGIAADDIETALSQFGQVKNKTARNQNGTGLGLSLVQLILEEHGGTFEFSSTPNVGTRATANFPFSRLRPRTSARPVKNAGDAFMKREA
ncbi:MAG: hypothetical protein EP348_03175 [Alphaproteobacteria bacterium]|nr:MAG: hypothetical protein EP348_03175 [Alphaproteobacteria bacterium]